MNSVRTASPNILSNAGGVRYGFGVPTLPGILDRNSLAGLARMVEQTQFESLWTSEVPTSPMFDSLTLLSHAAAVTERLRLGTGLILLPLRVPAVLAREVATIDVLSGGRLIVGVGLGRRREPLYAEYGVPTEARLDRYYHAIEVLRELLATGRAEYGGPEWILRGSIKVPQPTRTPPIIVGARHPNAVRRAAALGDGWIVSASAPRSEVADNFQLIQDELCKLQRDRSAFTITARINVLLDPTAGTRRRAADLFSMLYGPSMSSHRDAAFLGGASELVERIAELVSLGADRVILSPLFDHERHLDALVTKVLPQVTSV